MPFAAPFIEGLSNRDKELAQLFNGIPTSPGFLLPDMGGMDVLVKRKNRVAELAGKSKFKDVKDERGLLISVSTNKM
ncbi:MAG: hypothetical protein AB7I18_11600 [Candidatus Berkiella sp.]